MSRPSWDVDDAAIDAVWVKANRDQIRELALRFYSPEGIELLNGLREAVLGFSRLLEASFLCQYLAAEESWTEEMYSEFYELYFLFCGFLKYFKEVCNATVEEESADSICPGDS